MLDSYFNKVTNSETRSILRDYIIIEPFELNYSQHKDNYLNRFGKDNPILKYFDSMNELYIRQEEAALVKLKENSKHNIKTYICEYQKWIYSHLMWIIILDNYSMLSKAVNTKKDHLSKEYLKIGLSKINSPTKLLSSFKDFLKTTYRNSSFEGLPINTDNLEYIVSNFINFLETIDKWKDFYEYKRFNLFNNLQICINIKQDKGQKATIEIIDSYLKSQSNVIFGTYCQFSWWRPLSTGENAMLTLFARLFDTINKIDENKESYLLVLLDEAEIGFHPCWLKQYIGAIVAFFNIILKSLNKSKTRVQIILTTNNSIPLSDIQPSDVIYLQNHRAIKKEHNKTLGADLLTLFSDSFFISDGLIGRFSYDKIQDVINYASSGKYDKESHAYYSLIVENIGDEVIKNYLNNKLRSMNNQRSKSKND